MASVPVPQICERLPLLKGPEFPGVKSHSKEPRKKGLAQRKLREVAWFF